MKLWPVRYEINEFMNFVEKSDGEFKKNEKFSLFRLLLLLSIFFFEFPMLLIKIEEKSHSIPVELMFKMVRSP